MALLKKPASRYFVLAFVGLSLIGGASVTSATKNIHHNIRTYTGILARIYDNYVEEVDSKDLIYASIEGMMTSLDPHSAFLEKKQYDDLMVETQGKYGGVGISIDIRDDWLTVVSPIEGTPAYKLGIQAGDRIVAIEGESTKGITTADAAKILRGRKGTKVTITIRRKGDPQPFDLEIVRDVIELKSVPYHGIVRDGVGYLRLSRFSEESGQEVEDALRDLIDSGATAIVFDLRWNHGGLLTQSVAVADKFLERGRLISYTQGRHRSDRSEYHSTERPVLPPEVPVVILVNGATASASEIVSGALQDDGRALILGELTYGKGLVQTLIPLDADANLKLTTAKWYTPSGRCIQREIEGTGDDDEAAVLESGGKDELKADRVTGGIQPDIVMEGDTPTRYGLELLRHNHFFRFAVNYTAEHEDILRDWRAEPGVIEQFRAYLADQEFDYQTVAEMELERLLGLAREEGYGEQTLQTIEMLSDRLAAEKATDFEKNREYIEFGIEREVMSKAHGTEGLYSVILRTDTQAQAAVDLLIDETAYESAIEGKAAIAAVGKDAAVGDESFVLED